MSGPEIASAQTQVRLRTKQTVPVSKPQLFTFLNVDMLVCCHFELWEITLRLVLFVLSVLEHFTKLSNV